MAVCWRKMVRPDSSLRNYCNVRPDNTETQRHEDTEKPALEGSLESGFSLCLRAFVSLCRPAIRQYLGQMFTKERTVDSQTDHVIHLAREIRPLRFEHFAHYQRFTIDRAIDREY